MDAEHLKTLERDGFCVVQGVLPGADMSKLVDIAHRDDAKHLVMPHSEPMWHVRNSVRGIFEYIYQTSDLITSFDGMTFKYPGTSGLVLGYHIDQEQNDSHCYQSLVALTNSDASTGSVSFLVASHKHHADTLQRYHRDVDSMQPSNWQFLKLTEDDPLVRRCDHYTPSLKPGDMVLWDSRTVHCVVPATDSLTSRLVAYVCMVPRSFACEKTLRRRKDAFRRGASSTNWPHMFVLRGEKNFSVRRKLSKAPKCIASLV
jgi:hypothetical protein